jgi:hypothetical protein
MTRRLDMAYLVLAGGSRISEEVGRDLISREKFHA